MGRREVMEAKVAAKAKVAVADAAEGGATRVAVAKEEEVTVAAATVAGAAGATAATAEDSRADELVVETAVAVVAVQRVGARAGARVQGGVESPPLAAKH